MADPLSITASILAVLTVGVKTAKGLHRLADGLGKSGVQVRNYADEIDTFTKVLEAVRQQLLQQPDGASTKSQDILQRIVYVCERVLEPINRIQEHFNPLMVQFSESGKIGKLRSLSLRIHWLFSSKEELLFYLGSLKAQHRMLDTTLALMNLQSTKDRSSQNIYVLRISLDNSVAGIRSALDSSSHLKIGDASHNNTPPTRMLTANANSVGATLHPPQDATLDDITTIPQAAQDQVLDSEGSSQASNRLVVLSVSDDNEDEDEDDDARFTEIRQELVKNFADTAQDLWEDTRSLSREVLRYASHVLHASQNDASASNKDFAAAPEPAPMPAPEAIPMAAAPSTPATTSASKQEAPSQSALAVARQGELSDVITLKEEGGKSFAIPFDEVHRWENMRSYLQTFFGSDYARRSVIQQDRCEFLGPEGQYLLPKFWDRLVRPGWVITIRFPSDFGDYTSRDEIKLQELKEQIAKGKFEYQLQTQVKELRRQDDRIHIRKHGSRWDKFGLYMKERFLD